jgi:hypothetical protein
LNVSPARRAVRRHRQKTNDRWRCPEISVRCRSKLRNECAQMTTCSVGQPGARRSLGRAGAEYWSHNIVIGSVVTALPQAQHRAVPPLRAAAARVWRGVPATVLGAVEKVWCSCAPVPSRRTTHSPPPCSLPRPIRYCATNIRLARLAPVTPPAFPTAQFEKSGAGKARRTSRVFRA